MTHQILTDVAASISELKANPMKVVASGEGLPIAVLNRNLGIIFFNTAAFQIKPNIVLSVVQIIFVDRSCFADIIDHHIQISVIVQIGDSHTS